MIQTILLTIGGTSVVLAALFTFLGRVWINRIHTLDTENSAKKMSEFESNITKAVTELAARNEPKIHVHKIQVEAEYKRYESLWDGIQLVLPLISTIESRIDDPDLLKLTAIGIHQQHVALGDLVNACFPFVDTAVYNKAIMCVATLNKISPLLWEKDNVLLSKEALNLNMRDINKNIALFNSHTHGVAHFIQARIQSMTNLEK